MGEGLHSYILIGVEAAGQHPGEVFSISVIAKDGTANCGCILVICTTLHQYKLYFIIMMSHALCMYVCKAVHTYKFANSSI